MKYAKVYDLSKQQNITQYLTDLSGYSHPMLWVKMQRLVFLRSRDTKSIPRINQNFGKKTKKI